MKKKLLAAFCALSFAVPMVAFARTQPAALGNPGDPADAACFDDNNAGSIRNVCAGARLWSIPIIWDTPGPNKVIVIAASVGVQGAVSCTYRQFDHFNQQMQTIPFAAFTVNAFSTRSINVPNLVGGHVGHVNCSISGVVGGVSSGAVLNVNYGAP
jgi:hypothetical protein